ncbi:MAG: ClpXP protease specificity-enhancing factor [Acidobacteriota bacterium]
MSTDQDSQGSSTRPYLIRALHDWCTDNGFTPYLAVYVDRSVQVPQEYVKNNEIVLNVSFEATSQLQLGNDFVQFKARFGGVAREISVPVDHVIAIYARENGQGMAFPVPSVLSAVDDESAAGSGSSSAQVTNLRGEPNEGRSAGLRLARGAKASDAAKSEPMTDQIGDTAEADHVDGGDEPTPPDVPPPSNGRPTLRRIK